LSIARPALTASLLPSLGLGACASTRIESGPEPAPALVINLTSGPENLHAARMGLRLAEHGLADGRRVVVFLNVSAPTAPPSRASARQSSCPASRGRTGRSSSASSAPARPISATEPRARATPGSRGLPATRLTGPPLRGNFSRG
jgi:hypothetical protein